MSLRQKKQPQKLDEEWQQKTPSDKFVGGGFLVLVDYAVVFRVLFVPLRHVEVTVYDCDFPNV